MNKKILSVVLAASFCMSNLMAQDPHFSQFYNTSMFNNPAFIGAYQGTMRGTIAYRGQWSSILDNDAFNTYAGAFDTKMQVSKDDHMAFGFDVMNDQSGKANFNIFRSHLGMAYQKKIGGGGRRYKRGQNDQFISMGFQAGAGQHRFDPELWFSNQFDPKTGGINTNLASGEPAFVRSTKLYLDVNAGLAWYAILGDNKSVYISGALQHANAPYLRLREDRNYGEVLKWRWIAQVGAELPFSNEMSILPAVIYQTQGPSQMTVAGANFRYNGRDWREVALRMGLWTRFANRLNKGQNMDALILTAVLEGERSNIGLSYDINTSKLQTASNYRGAFEVTMTFLKRDERRRVKLSCPRF